jgi:Skp family chaperone for outer membrane proteins
MALKDSVDQYMQKLSAMKTGVTDKERAALEKEFMERQQRFQSFADANRKNAAEKEKALTEAAVKKTNALLQEYCEKKNYDFILGTTVNGSILAANRSRDVTEDVIRYLNEQIK